MTRKTYIELYERYLAGIATRDELELLKNYKDRFDIDQFDDDLSVPDQELIRNRILGNIESKLFGVKPLKPMSKIWWSVAASLLILTTATYILRHHTGPVQTKPIPAKIVASVIVPGSNKAVLILGNGSKINLNQASNGRISQAGPVLIKKIKNGQLVYERTNAGNNEVSYNTIVTPKGGQYQVSLPDGTMVWLDAASSLKYPTAFTGPERHVELNGEAYFEVAKNKNMPFTVTAGKVNIKVLGTHFNVSAYDDDPANKTTLLEGAVQLSKGDHKVMLIPGQQAVVDNTTQNIQLKTVNVEDAVAWKNGYFSFRKENIQSAMRKIARWYDVDVEFRGEVSNKFLGGTVSRTEDIGEMLSYLQLTGIANFKIIERRIIVKGN